MGGPDPVPGISKQFQAIELQENISPAARCGVGRQAKAIAAADGAVARSVLSPTGLLAPVCTSEVWGVFVSLRDSAHYRRQADLSGPISPDPTNYPKKTEA